MDQVSEPDAALLRLYEALSAKTKFVGLTHEQRRAYKRQRMAEYRERDRDLADKGRPATSATTIRNVLSNIALRMLQTGGPGSDLVAAGLEEFFGQPGAMTAIRKARSLQPKVLKLKSSQVAGKVR